MGNTRTALVTGAASGIGLAITQALSAAGANVIAVDRDPAVVSQAPEKEGAPFVRGHVTDLADRAQIGELLSWLADTETRVDILVNCAGIVRLTPEGDRYSIETLTADGWDLTLAINLTAPFLLSQGVIPGMKAAGWGRIVNITSRAGQTYVASANPDYSASKAGLIGLTRMLAGECAAYGITVNAVAPGRVGTPLADAQSDELVAAQLSGVPVGRKGTTDEVAAAVVYLASEQAGYTTGVTLAVNGGAFIA